MTQALGSSVIGSTSLRERTTELVLIGIRRNHIAIVVNLSVQILHRAV